MGGTLLASGRKTSGHGNWWTLHECWLPAFGARGRKHWGRSLALYKKSQCRALLQRCAQVYSVQCIGHVRDGALASVLVVARMRIGSITQKHLVFCTLVAVLSLSIG